MANLSLPAEGQFGVIQSSIRYCWTVKAGNESSEFLPKKAVDRNIFPICPLPDLIGSGGRPASSRQQFFAFRQQGFSQLGVIVRIERLHHFMGGI